MELRGVGLGVCAQPISADNRMSPTGSQSQRSQDPLRLVAFCLVGLVGLIGVLVVMSVP